MDAIDRRIINALQDDLPICERPFEVPAARLGVTEDALIERLRGLCGDGTLNRFGPLFNAERMGGSVTLAAMRVPGEDFDAAAEAVNAHPEVSQNYARDDDFNMWFVISAETPERIPAVVAEIEAETGLPVYDMPKIEEFFVGLRFDA